MTLESFFTGLSAMFIITLKLAFFGVLFGCLLILPFAFLMRGIAQKKKAEQNRQDKGQLKPKEMPKLRRYVSQPASDKQRLYEIENGIFWKTGSIQANPMSRGATAMSDEIKRLELEKIDLLKKITDSMGRITIRKVWNTFLPEQKREFEERIYQYQQDVNRGGIEPEIAAANRGLTIVDGRPVPKEVANRLQTMQQLCAGKAEGECVKRFGYENLINKALEEGELSLCIIGFGEYHIKSRDERFQNFTDYALLLLNFDWYYTKHPNSKLKEIYEATLEEMLCSDKPSYIYCAAVCVFTHIEELERNPNFCFELTDRDKYMQLVVSSMELHHEAIVEFIDRRYNSQVIAERFYRAVLKKLSVI